MATRLTDNPKAELDLYWVTDPPIFEISETDFPARMATMGTALVGWTGKVPDSTSPDADVYKRDWKAQKRTQQEMYNDRVDSTASMMNMLNTKVFTESNYAAEYRVHGLVVGVIVVSKWDPVYVDDLLTHPGTAGAGSLLIEHVIRKSKKEWGSNGKVELWALDGDAAAAYEALGFVRVGGTFSDGGGSMKLSPAKKPDLWKPADGTFVLAKSKATDKFIA